MLRYLVILILILPFVDLYLLLKVANVIGIWKTLGIIIITGIVGAELIRREGRHVLYKLQNSVTRGEVSRNVLEGGFLVLAGGFLLSPGLITDLLGVLFVFRPLRERLVAYIMNKKGNGFDVEIEFVEF